MHRPTLLWLSRTLCHVQATSRTCLLQPSMPQVRCVARLAQPANISAGGEHACGCCTQRYSCSIDSLVVVAVRSVTLMTVLLLDRYSCRDSCAQCHPGSTLRTFRPSLVSACLSHLHQHCPRRGTAFPCKPSPRVPLSQTLSPSISPPDTHTCTHALTPHASTCTPPPPFSHLNPQCFTQLLFL
jgi:hypothetical protein